MNDYHFKFNGIFGPIITSYLDPEELIIILDYCGQKRMTRVDACAKYCVQHDLRDYLYFHVHPDAILCAAAEYHNQYFVDKAIARTDQLNFGHAMVYAVKTGDIPWITKFRDLGGASYQKCMLAAMQLNKPEIVKLMHRWGGAVSFAD